MKYGDINTAYRDFYATNPQSVSEEGYKGVCVIYVEYCDYTLIRTLSTCIKVPRECIITAEAEGEVRIL